MVIYDSNGGERATRAVTGRVVALGLAVEKGTAGEERVVGR